MLALLRIFFVFSALCAIGIAWMVAADYVVPAYDPAEEAAKSVWFVMSAIMLGLSMTLCAYAVCRVSQHSHRQLVIGAISAIAAIMLFFGVGIVGAERDGALVAIAAGGSLFVGFAHWSGREVGRRAAGHLTTVGADGRLG